MPYEVLKSWDCTLPQTTFGPLIGSFGGTVERSPVATVPAEEVKKWEATVQFLVRLRCSDCLCQEYYTTAKGFRVVFKDPNFFRV